MILERRPTSEIKKAAHEEGMRFLRESAVEKVLHGHDDAARDQQGDVRRMSLLSDFMARQARRPTRPSRVFKTNRKGIANSKASSRSFTASKGAKYFVGVYSTTANGERGPIVACAQLRTKGKHGHAKPHKPHGKPHKPHKPHGKPHKPHPKPHADPPKPPKPHADPPKPPKPHADPPKPPEPHADTPKPAKPEKSHGKSDDKGRGKKDRG